MPKNRKLLNTEKGFNYQVQLLKDIGDVLRKTYDREGHAQYSNEYDYLFNSYLYLMARGGSVTIVNTLNENKILSLNTIDQFDDGLLILMNGNITSVKNFILGPIDLDIGVGARKLEVIHNLYRIKDYIHATFTSNIDGLIRKLTDELCDYLNKYRRLGYSIHLELYTGPTEHHTTSKKISPLWNKPIKYNDDLTLCLYHYYVSPHLSTYKITNMKLTTSKFNQLRRKIYAAILKPIK